jgi:hypothetical protein
MWGEGPPSEAVLVTDDGPGPPTRLRNLSVSHS